MQCSSEPFICYTSHSTETTGKDAEWKGLRGNIPFTGMPIHYFPSEALPPKVSTVFLHYCQLKKHFSIYVLEKHLKYETIIFPWTLKCLCPWYIAKWIFPTLNSFNSKTIKYIICSESQGTLSVQVHRKPQRACHRLPILGDKCTLPFQIQRMGNCKEESDWCENKTQQRKVKSAGFVCHPECEMTDPSSNRPGQIFLPWSRSLRLNQLFV